MITSRELKKTRAVSVIASVKIGMSGSTFFSLSGTGFSVCPAPRFSVHSVC